MVGLRCSPRDHDMPAATLTVRDLFRLWKPHNERLSAHDAEHPTNVRFHRACSWLQRVEQVTGKDDLDLALLSQWIAFNSLYGQWDHGVREPVADNVCWKHFLERMLSLDEGSHIVDALMENKPLVLSIFDDEFLSRRGRLLTNSALPSEPVSHKAVGNQQRAEAVLHGGYSVRTCLQIQFSSARRRDIRAIIER